MTTQLLYQQNPIEPIFQTISRSCAERAIPAPARSSSIVDLFHHHFELIPATTDELKMEVYKLRYQVYCLETGFESTEDCRSTQDATGRLVYYEADEFDHRSAHYLIRHRASQLYIATTRLILPSSKDIGAPFPIEVNCKLKESISDHSTRKQLAETSRYAVSRELKRLLSAGRARMLGKNMMENDSLEHITQRYLSVGLIACLLQATRRHGIQHWYAAMEQALLRMLQRYGIHFTPIGPATDFHGLRVPCMINVDEMVSSIERTNYPVWELITNRGEFA